MAGKTSLGNATLDLRVSTAAAVASVKSAADQMARELKRVNSNNKLELKLDARNALSELGKLRSKMQAELKAALSLDLSALTLMAGKIETVGQSLKAIAGELRDAAKQLREARSGAGGGGNGGGGPPAGGNPARGNGINEYAAQLRGIQADLKGFAITSTAAESATRSLKTTIDAEIASLRNLGVLTREQQARLESLRVTSGAAGQELTRFGNSASRAAQEAARAAAKAASDAARAQAESINRLGRDLQTANSQYDRGATSLRTYLREMERIRAAGQSMAAGLQAGSKEALNLERVLSGLSRGAAKVNDSSIIKLRSDLAAVRAEYERATGAAGRFNFAGQRAATQAYSAELQKLETRIRAVGERSNVTGGQLRALNQVSSTLASQQNALNGIFSGVGLSANVANALKSLPQFAAAAGGSLGAAAAQSTALASGFSGIIAAAGPVGIAIAAVVAVVGALTLGLTKAVGAYAPFQDAIQNAKGTLGLFGQEGQALGKQLQTLAQDPSLAKMGFNSIQAAKAIEELGSRGLDTSEILNGGLNTAATLAAASGVKDLNVAAEVLVGTMRAFNITGEEAAGVPDILANAANVSALKLEDFRLAIAMGGSAARTSGTSLIEFTGIMSLMRDRLISASDAGTSFKSFVAALTPNSKEAAARMKEIGFNAFDAQGKMKPFRAIVENLATSLQGMTEKQKLSTLELIFGSDGVRIATTALDAYNTRTAGGERLLDARTAALERQGTAEKAAAERTASLAGANAELAAKLQSVAQRIGGLLAPAMESITRAFIKFVDTAVGPAVTRLESMFTALDALKKQGTVSLSLQLKPGDTGTEQILKVLGAPFAVGAAIIQPANVENLRLALQRGGVLPATNNPITAAAQFKDVAQNYGYYLKLAQDLDAKLKAAYAATGGVLDFTTQNAIQQLQRQAGPGALLPGQQRMSEAQEVSGLATLANLGKLRAGGTPFGQKYFGGQTHNGEDLFAKLGTDVTAAFSGTLTTRWSETTGRILELVDSTGKKLLLGHLEGFKDSLEGLPKDIQAAFKASKDGSISVAQGQVIGKVGQTGTLAHKDLGPGNAHVHVMAVLPNGQVVDPKSVTFKPAGDFMPTNVAAQAAKGGPVDQERLKKYAGTLLTKQDQVTAAKDVDGILRVKKAIDAFAASSPRAAAALDVMRDELGKTRKEASEFGAGFDGLTEQLRRAENQFKLSGDASAYARALEGISAAALKAAASEEKANGVTKTSKAISDLAADSAQKARQQREALARTAEQGDNTEAGRAQARATLLAQLDKDLAAGKLQQAQATADQLQQNLDTQLAAYKNNAAERLRTEQQLGPQVLAAQKRVLEAQRDASIAAAKEKARTETLALTKKFGKGKEPQDLLQGIAANEQTAIGTAESVFNTKISALYSASTERINSATAAVTAKNKQLADQRLAIEKQVTDQLSGLNESQRQAKVQEAQDELSRLKLSRQNQLDAVKGNAAETLRVERETSAQIQAQQERLAQTVLIAAKRKADADKAAALASVPKGATQVQRDAVEAQAEAVRLKAVSAAYRAYSLAVSTSSQEARQSVATATEGQKTALDDLKKKYESVTDAFTQKLLAGTPTEEEFFAYWKDLDQLFKDAKKSGLDLSPVIVSLRNQARDLGNSVGGVREWADEMAAAAEVGDKRYSNKTALADYATRSTFGVGREGYDNALAGFGVRSIEELEQINGDAAASLKRVYGGVIAEMLADMEAGARRAETILENTRAEMERVADEVAQAAELAQIDKDSSDVQGVRGMGGSAQQLSGFLTGEGNSFFGERFWTELGEAGRERFRQEIERLSPEDFAALGEDALRGVLDGIGGNEDFAALAEKVKAGLGVALQNTATSAGYTDLGRVLETFSALDSGAEGYADTLRSRLLPELERIRDAASDPTLKQTAEQAIAALNGEIDAAQQLVTVLGQARLARLSSDKEAGRLGEGEYIGARRTAEIEQENARYRLDIQGKTGKALELAETQHQINLGTIMETSIRAYADLTTRLRVQAAETTAKAEAAVLERQRRDGLISETAYLNAKTEASVRAAEREGQARLDGLKKGSPEYIAAEEALQAEIDDIRQKGRFEAADSLAGATEQLKGAARELAQALGETEAPYQNQLDLLGKLKTKYPELGKEIDVLVGKYTKLQTATEGDQNQNLADSLLEAEHALALAEGRNDGPTYLAGLQASLAYWRGRLEGLENDIPAYVAALKKIADLESKVKAEKANPIVDRLGAIAAAVGKGGKLQKTITAGLDGLAAYFKGGGKEGGANAILAGAQALIGGLGEVFKTGDEDVDRAIDTFVTGVQATLGQLIKGDWIGALITGITTVIATIIDLFQGGANSAKKAAEAIGKATEGIKIFDTSKYAKVVSRGGLLGFFGFKTTEIDQGALDIARSLGDAVYSSVSGALMAGFKSGQVNVKDVSEALRASLAEYVVQGLIAGFLQSAGIQAILQPFLDAYITAFRDKNKQGMADALADLDTAMTTFEQQTQEFANGIKPITDRIVGGDLGGSVRDSIFSGIRDGMIAGLKAGKTGFGELGIDVKKMLGEQILQGIIDGFLKGEIFKQKIQPLIDKYLAADPKDRADIASEIQTAITDVTSGLADLYQDVLLPTANKLGLFGSEMPKDGATGNGNEITLGGGPGVKTTVADQQGQISTASITVLSDALSVGGAQITGAAQLFGNGVGAFGGHVDRFGQYVTQFGQIVSGARSTSWGNYDTVGR